MIIALCIISIGCAWGLYAVHGESQTRTKQFCKLSVSRQNDLVDRYIGSKAFLQSPAGKEDTPINTYIRGSLPQVKASAQAEDKRIPSICRQLFTIKQVPND